MAALAEALRALRLQIEETPTDETPPLTEAERAQIAAMRARWEARASSSPPIRDTEPHAWDARDMLRTGEAAR